MVFFSGEDGSPIPNSAKVVSASEKVVPTPKKAAPSAPRVAPEKMRTRSGTKATQSIVANITIADPKNYRETRSDHSRNRRA